MTSRLRGLPHVVMSQLKPMLRTPRDDSLLLPAQSVCLISVLCTRSMQQDMTQVDLDSVLPQTTVMVVSVTGSTTSGKPLSEEDLRQCLRVSTQCTRRFGNFC